MIVIIENNDGLPVIRMDNGPHKPAKDIVLRGVDMEIDEYNRLIVSGDKCEFKYYALGQQINAKEAHLLHANEYKVGLNWRDNKTYHVEKGWKELKKSERHKYTFSNYIIDEFDKL